MWCILIIFDSNRHFLFRIPINYLEDAHLLSILEDKPESTPILEQLCTQKSIFHWIIPESHKYLMNAQKYLLLGGREDSGAYFSAPLIPPTSQILLSLKDLKNISFNKALSYFKDLWIWLINSKMKSLSSIQIEVFSNSKEDFLGLFFRSIQTWSRQ